MGKAMVADPPHMLHNGVPHVPPEIMWGTAAACPTPRVQVQVQVQVEASSAAPLLVEDWEWDEVVLLDARCAGLLREQPTPNSLTPGWLQLMHIHLLQGIQRNNIDAMRRAVDLLSLSLQLETARQTTVREGCRRGETLKFVAPPRRCGPMRLPVYAIPHRRSRCRAQGAATPHCYLKECVLICTRLSTLIRRLTAFQIHPTYAHLGIDDPSRVHNTISYTAARLSTMLCVVRRYIHLANSLADQHRAARKGGCPDVIYSLIVWATRGYGDSTFIQQFLPL